MAAWSDVLKLIPLIEGTDDSGFPGIIEGKPRQVFANKKSIRSQEFYMAKQSGIELSYMFEIRTIDYNGEERVQFGEDGIKYDVERTYEKGEFVELICKRKSDDHAP